MTFCWQSGQSCLSSCHVDSWWWPKDGLNIRKILQKDLHIATTEMGWVRKLFCKRITRQCQRQWSWKIGLWWKQQTRTRLAKSAQDIRSLISFSPLKAYILAVCHIITSSSSSSFPGKGFLSSLTLLGLSVTHQKAHRWAQIELNTEKEE